MYIIITNSQIFNSVATIVKFTCVSFSSTEPKSTLWRPVYDGVLTRWTCAADLQLPQPHWPRALCCCMQTLQPHCDGLLIMYVLRIIHHSIVHCHSDFSKVLWRQALASPCIDFSFYSCHNNLYLLNSRELHHREEKNGARWLADEDRSPPPSQPLTDSVQRRWRLCSGSPRTLPRVCGLPQGGVLKYS
jgi:hypothetical protein